MTEDEDVPTGDGAVLVDHMHCCFCWRAIPLDFDEEGNQITDVAYMQSAIPMIQQSIPQLIGAQPTPQIGFRPHNIPICERCRAPQQAANPASKLVVVH